MKCLCLTRQVQMGNRAAKFDGLNLYVEFLTPVLELM
jgi:hypothetical protein